MTSAAIELRQITLKRGARVILDALDLALNEGEVLALVGPNGSGKSTALKVMAGRASSPMPARSAISAARPSPARKRARLVSYLPQDFRSHWDMTVHELIALGTMRGRPGFGRQGTIPSNLIDRLDLQDLIDRRLSTLSGGERSRAAIAASMAGGPKVLLADEPTASLDIAHQLRLLRAIREGARDMTALLVLHDLNLAARFADRIAVMQNGRVVLAGPTNAVLESSVLDEVFETPFRRIGEGGLVQLLAGRLQNGRCP